MNVLIYSDEGASAESTLHTKMCLRNILSDRYAVSVITARQLLSEPWQAHTALLVMPGGADLPYCRALNGEGTAKIRNYVMNGGRFLGLCAGAYFACQSIEFEAGTSMEVSGPRELAFFEGIGRGAVYKGFQYGTNKGTRAAPVYFPELGKSVQLFFNGGCLFDGIDKRAQTLGVYEGQIECESRVNTPPAVVYKSIGDGKIVLSGVHMEYDIDHVKQQQDIAPETRAALSADDSNRVAVVRYLLQKLDLELGDETRQSTPKLTPLLLTSMAEGVPNTDTVANALQPAVEDGVLNDSNDCFEFIPVSTASTAVLSRALDKLVVVYPAGQYPANRETPFFDHNLYYTTLAQAQSTVGHSFQTMPVLGGTMFYGEVVTSTSSMIEKNPRLMQLLPHGSVMVGTLQVAGRGRGSNVWVNPLGVLAVSGILRVPVKTMPHSLVFLQYLVSLAMVETINSMGDGYKQLGLALKWPNDIYIRQPNPSPEAQSHIKIGGTIVSCQVIQGSYVFVFGSGTNVNNPKPTTSLNSCIDSYNRNHPGANLQPIRLEELLARYLSQLGSMFELYCQRGFEPFEQRYYGAWLHSNAVVTLERYFNAKARIKGISNSQGMLLAEGIDSNGSPTGTMYELKPDGNSFDMFKGLIREKM